MGILFAKVGSPKLTGIKTPTGQLCDSGGQFWCLAGEVVPSPRPLAGRGGLWPQPVRCCLRLSSDWSRLHAPGCWAQWQDASYRFSRQHRRTTPSLPVCHQSTNPPLHSPSPHLAALTAPALAIRHSPFAIRHSPFAIRRSSLVTLPSSRMLRRPSRRARRLAVAMDGGREGFGPGLGLGLGLVGLLLLVAGPAGAQGQRTLLVYEGQNVRFVCNASRLNAGLPGGRDVNYQWEFNDDLIIATGEHFAIRNIRKADEGQYKCKVTAFLDGRVVAGEESTVVSVRKSESAPLLAPRPTIPSTYNNHKLP
ncbi:unnamed protein product [Protopolystoma xenopodis]|uniref:Ig-like domain-containing protein n=1 Tax=Protopolystoma xenopodis TaxID=117903 RepID=A0A448WS06_9PLAT|nr:unnamed protein product [Protopolystoma xenopodis]